MNAGTDEDDPIGEMLVAARAAARDAAWAAAWDAKLTEFNTILEQMLTDEHERQLTPA